MTRKLRALDVERLENTSIISALGGSVDGMPAVLAVDAGTGAAGDVIDGCVASCRTTCINICGYSCVQSCCPVNSDGNVLTFPAILQ